MKFLTDHPQPSCPNAPDLLTQDIAHDIQLLRAYFATNGQWIGLWSIHCLELRLTPKALCQVGVLREKTIGRYDDGYAPGERMLSPTRTEPR